MRCSVPLLALCCVTAPAPLVGQEMFVQAAETGQGVSRIRGNDCLVLTAGHVAANGASGRVVTEGGVSAPATFAREYRDDVAILRVSAGSEFPCGPWRVPDTVDVILNSATSGYLRLRTQAGGLTQIPVSIVARNDRFLTVAPTTGQIRQTMSGSPLYVGGEMVGMLLSVDADAGRGHVFRVDALEDLVRSYLADRARPAPTPLPQPAPDRFRIVTLRSKPDNPSEGSARKALQRLDLFEAGLNPAGHGVANQYVPLNVPVASLGLSTRNLGDSLGALVTRVDSGPARVAGIAPGDFILAFDATPVKATNHLYWLVRRSQSGRVIAIKLLRNNAPHTLRVVLSERNESVIVDYATALMWTRPSSNIHSFADAEEYLRQWNYLGYGGHSDWRLPTLEEALSLMEPFVTEGQRSRLNETYFSRPYSDVWTSDDCGGLRWAVDYEKGTLHCGLKEHLKAVMMVR